MPEYSQELRDRVAAVTNQRARRLLELLIQNGPITTVEFRERYGYEHAPRAAGDARDLGFRVEKDRVKHTNSQGRSSYVACYRLEEGDSGVRGRLVFPTRFRKRLHQIYGDRCTMCGGLFPPNALTIDHRVPYRVAGDARDRNLHVEDYMLLDVSCQRSKSWSCEHCRNWLEIRDPAVCRTCMWASPEEYQHIAMEPRRRLTLNWEGAAITEYERLRARAEAAGLSVEDYVKHRLM